MNKPSGRKNRQYEDVVYQRLRHILMSYRNLRSSETGYRYDWGELAGDISVYFADLFPKNSLENFVRGWKEDQSNIKSQSEELSQLSVARTVYKYSIPKPERIEAIIEFLTSKDSKGYFCSKEMLLAPSKIQAPFFLQHYLDDEETPDDFLLKDHYTNEVQRSYVWDDQNRPYDLSLQFLSALSNKATFIDIVKRAIPEKKNYKHENKLMADESSIYSGWAVHTKEQNLFVFAKNLRTKTTVFYLSIGYGSLISDFPKYFVLLGDCRIIRA